MTSINLRSLRAPDEHAEPSVRKCSERQPLVTELIATLDEAMVTTCKHDNDALYDGTRQDDCKR